MMSGFDGGGGGVIKPNLAVRQVPVQRSKLISVAFNRFNTFFFGKLLKREKKNYFVKIRCSNRFESHFIARKNLFNSLVFY